MLNRARKKISRVLEEYHIELRPDEEALPLTRKIIAVFNKLVAKEAPRYQRK